MASSSATILLGFMLLTGNSIMAVNKSWGDAAAVSFVFASYLSLAVLFCCLRQFESAPAGSAARDTARAGVWLATTLLTAMFSWRVAGLMPWPVAAGVWMMGGSTVAGGSYAMLFVPTAHTREID